MGITMLQSNQVKQNHSTFHWFQTTQPCVQEKEPTSYHEWDVPKQPWLHFCISSWLEHGILIKLTQRIHAKNTHNHSSIWIFECCILPMGIKPATNIFWSRMVCIFQFMTQHKPHPYIHNIFHGMGKNFDKHLSSLYEIFKCLKGAGMQVNLDKSKLCAKPVEFLGFLLMQTGHQPTQK